MKLKHTKFVCFNHSTIQPWWLATGSTLEVEEKKTVKKWAKKSCCLTILGLERIMQDKGNVLNCEFCGQFSLHFFRHRSHDL